MRLARSLIDSWHARLLMVGLGTAVAYLWLGVLAYALYLGILEGWHDRAAGVSLVMLQTVFYAVLATHFVASMWVGRGIASRLHVSAVPGLIAGGVILAPMLMWTLFVLSYYNACGAGASFPVPGYSCR